MEFINRARMEDLRPEEALTYSLHTGEKRMDFADRHCLRILCLYVLCALMLDLCCKGFLNYPPGLV